MLQLVDAYCKPLLLYGSEVYWGGGGAKSYKSALRRAWSYTFWKIFGVSEKVAYDIQLFTGICSLEDTLNRRRLSFWSGLAKYWQQCNSLLERLERLVCLPITVSLWDFMFSVLVDVIDDLCMCLCVFLF